MADGAVDCAVLFMADFWYPDDGDDDAVAVILKIASILVGLWSYAVVLMLDGRNSPSYCFTLTKETNALKRST